MAPTVRIRMFAPDDAAELTRLVHLAYAELAAQGLNFTAANQDEATTLARSQHGATLLAEVGGSLLGSVTMSWPPSRSVRELSEEARQPGMAWLNQLAVAPAARGQGIASLLWRTGRAWATEQGATHIGLDTALPALHLRALYAHWGFVECEIIHWEGKTYDSVVMSRPAGRAERRTHTASSQRETPTNAGH